MELNKRNNIQKFKKGLKKKKTDMEIQTSCFKLLLML